MALLLVTGVFDPSRAIGEQPVAFGEQPIAFGEQLFARLGPRLVLGISGQLFGSLCGIRGLPRILFGDPRLALGEPRLALGEPDQGVGPDLGLGDHAGHFQAPRELPRGGGGGGDRHQGPVMPDRPLDPLARSPHHARSDRRDRRKDRWSPSGPSIWTGVKSVTIVWLP